jgi:ubiquinol-cytochrome c reductase cytochrome b subunit
MIYRNEHNYERGHWVRLGLSVPVALLLLFTGYVLRADATGEAAGTIAEHIMLAIPLCGELLNKLLFDLQTGGMKRVYAQHVVGLVVLGTWCAWPHLRRYSARWRDHPLLLIILLVISVGWAVPLEVEHFGMLHINGPWFFLGLQELLRYFPPLWAGVIFPGLALSALLFLPHSGRYRQPVIFGTGLWLLFYTILTTIGYNRGLSG